MSTYSNIKKLERKKRRAILWFFVNCKLGVIHQGGTADEMTNPETLWTAHKMGYKDKKGYYIFRVRINRTEPRRICAEARRICAADERARSEGGRIYMAETNFLGETHLMGETNFSDETNFSGDSSYMYERKYTHNMHYLRNLPKRKFKIAGSHTQPFSYLRYVKLKHRQEDDLKSLENPKPKRAQAFCSMAAELIHKHFKDLIVLKSYYVSKDANHKYYDIIARKMPVFRKSNKMQFKFLEDYIEQTIGAVSNFIVNAFYKQSELRDNQLLAETDKGIGYLESFFFLTVENR